MTTNPITTISRVVPDMLVLFHLGDRVSFRVNGQFLPKGAEIIGTAALVDGTVEITTYETAAPFTDGNPHFERVLANIVNCAEVGLPLPWALDLRTFEEENEPVKLSTLLIDREPQPGDGPDYYHDHAAWERRQPAARIPVPDFDTNGFTH